MTDSSSKSEGAPKTAVEIAMEKLRARGDYQESVLSDEQKQKIAEVRSRYKAKIAELEIKHQSKLDAAASLEELEQLKQELIQEKSRLNEEMENKVHAIRSDG